MKSCRNRDVLSAPALRSRPIAPRQRSRPAQAACRLATISAMISCLRPWYRSALRAVRKKSERQPDYVHSPIAIIADKHTNRLQVSRSIC